MTNDEFATEVAAVRGKLYKTAMLYMGSHTQALDALDEAVYKALRSHRKLRKPEFFSTWITRILINECHNELRRQKRLCPIDALPETAVQEFDSLPLREAIGRLPKDLKDIIILRYFSGFTLVETARMLEIPQGTAATRQRKALRLLRLEFEEEVEE
ncbi:MAG: sigma-70 family RNA polymerase sigma factor [Clostridia bacterium]|nr:sigma-70 family RNA polymerase sigma factor [Clostridia bacterium]